MKRGKHRGPRRKEERMAERIGTKGLGWQRGKMDIFYKKAKRTGTRKKRKTERT